jgi:hypothetical protein
MNSSSTRGSYFLGAVLQDVSKKSSVRGQDAAWLASPLFPCAAGVNGKISLVILPKVPGWKYTVDLNVK